MSELRKYLEYKAYGLRVESIIMTSKAGSGHPTSCLSAADLVAAIFFYAMHFDPHNFDNPDNDRFILSKGHAAPLLYAAWKELGLITQQELYTYRQIDSRLEGHPTLRFPYAEAATGSLGMGLSIGTGMAISALRDWREFHTYVLLGDSELSEGSIWEAAEIASYYKLCNLIAVVDVNRLGQAGPTMHEYHMERYRAKFEAFGWRAIVIDGHDMYQIMKALEKAREESDQPAVILAKTIKGYGVESVENKNGYHGKPFAQQEVTEILQQMETRFADAAHYKHTYDWQPQIPETTQKKEEPCIGASIMPPAYTLGTMVATRHAYGQALADLGSACPGIFSLDAEVSNSTFAEIFQKKFPERFVQCFIAEQNMVSMAVGMQRLGKVPFVSTFSAFLTRAHDQLRMAAIGTAALRVCGSHAGVSIGADGPSQMGLEDIGFMCALPGSAVLYPSDAVSTHRLMEQMVEYNQGISYIRTTRGATPIIYELDQKFVIGGCHVLKTTGHDSACIIAAGITLHEALKAYDILKQKGISVSVIDLYSIKPLDKKTIVATAKSSGKRIITVEDHYLEGGLGEQVCYAVRNTGISVDCLAVTQLPRSGKPQELMALMGIDADAIVKAVTKSA